MAIEIERKYLVIDERWRDGVMAMKRLRDGLVSSSGLMKVRVRIMDDSASLCVKGSKHGCSRSEFEYEIPYSDAEALLSECSSVLEKTRHLVPHSGNIWEVDTYHGDLEGLVVAEIELHSEGQAFDLPSWAGREVTHDVKFQKGNLLKTWQHAKRSRDVRDRPLAGDMAR